MPAQAQVGNPSNHLQVRVVKEAGGGGGGNDLGNPPEAEARSAVKVTESLRTTSGGRSQGNERRG